MKLKPIPTNTVVHTPTETEAKELLAILHENGWKWCAGEDLSVVSHIAGKEAIGINLYNEEKGTIIGFLHVETAQREHFPILTLAEFKEKYCEMTEPLTEKAEEASVIQQKPQPKFKVEDLVSIRRINKWGRITDVHYSEDAEEWEYYIKVYPNGLATALESNLTPYTEPETKPTEDMGTKELNLCELLKGHEGEELYSLIAGKCTLKGINEGAGFPICIILDACTTWEYLTKDGKRFNVSDAGCMLFPSRALYEQYPLDPYTAWMKWQEEQKKFALDVNFRTYNTPDFGEVLYFRTPSDRDKCIEEIKAIINKHSNKNKV